MKLNEAIKLVKKTLARQEANLAAGRGKGHAAKIALCRDHLAKLIHMRDIRSPWHDYSDMIAVYEISDFVPRIVQKS